MIEAYVAQLGTELGLVIPPADESKNFKIIFNEIGVTVRHLDPSGIYFYAPLLPLPVKDREVFLIQLMKANLMGQGTGGGVIGLKDDDSLLTLSLALPYDMNYKAFRQALEEFVNYVEYWKGQIKTAS
jgi:hypothetical protein